MISSKHPAPRPPSPAQFPERGVAPHPRGRAEVITRVLDACDSTTPVVAITGPAGIGRSLVLSRVRARLAERQVTTVDVPLVRAEHDIGHLVSWIGDELGLPAVREPAGPALHRLLTALAARRDPVVVLLDDAHRIAPDVLAALAGPVRALAGSRVTFVGAFRTPVDGHRTAAAALRARGLVHEERLRPLGAGDVERMVTDLLRAVPAPGLAAALRDRSRGLPAVVRAAVDGYARTGCLRIVDHHAHLVEQRMPRMPLTHPLFAAFGGPDSPSWSVVKALALLGPLRGDVVGLIAESADLDPVRVREALAELRASGVLLPGSNRFRVPMLATLLTACLGPYERSRTAQLAVRAVWSGAASYPDGDQLGERLADAGGLVDRDRAAAELLARGTEVATRRPDLADRWLRTAAELTTDPDRRAAALHRHATTCALLQRFTSAVGSTGLVLRDHLDRLPPEIRQELLLVHVVALASSGPDALREFLAAPEPDPVARAVALCLLDRWPEAHAELTAARPADPFGRLVLRLADAPLGIEEPAGDPEPTGGTAADVRRVLLRALSPGQDDSRPKTAAAATIGAAGTGRWDRALDHARRGLATATVHGSAPGRTAAVREMAVILVARGQLNRARAVLAEARSRHLVLPHLLALPEAELERAMGAHRRARQLIEEGIAAADERGVVTGTAELWLWLAEADRTAGAPEAARRCVDRIDRLVEHSAEPRRHQLLAHVGMHRDRAAARELVELSRRADHPWELAQALVTVAGSGLGEAKLLLEAYSLYGELDALIPRARLRLLMREREVTVPGRGATVAENERLLAVLIANGLTNSQVATVVGSSEKGVEARLTRFFHRTGYRSRAELTTATLSHEIAPRATTRC
ncbi:AAA family ATPase [Saccharopolyspora cebuensis]|uniref:AAA family ATPase n=1 Tax=Saccharopolyspora cebuensis TaxID=418759 RepID=A0ABV4CDZ8_9PSEU